MIFVMAQGSGDRWTVISRKTKRKLEPFKQLTRLGYNTIIGRTVAQIKRFFGHMPIAVLCWTDIEQALPSMVKYGHKTPGSLLSGILQTRDRWSGRMTFVLGDVVFSNAAMQAIATEIRGIVFYGRIGPNTVTGKGAGELFAFSFDEAYYDLIDLTIQRLMTERSFPEKLWGLAENMNVIEMSKWGTRQIIDRRRFQIIDDYTDDVDSPEEFIEFYKTLSVAAMEDDTTFWSKEVFA